MLFRRLLVFSLSLSFSNWAIFSTLKLLNLLAAIFLLNKNNTDSSPAFFGQRFNNLQRTALLTSLIQYGEVSFQIWWTTAGYGELCVWFNQSETGKYFEWIITAIILLLILEVSNNWHYPTTNAGRFTSFFAAVRADQSNSAFASQLMQARRKHKY